MLGTDRILGLDIGASTVKAAEFQPSKSHGLRLTNFNHAELGIDPEHEENRNALIVSTVRNVLREKNIKATTVVFSVSGQSVFTRFVKLPPVDETKVNQIIQYEAQQNVPFPIDEVIWDYQLLGSGTQGELEVVLLAIKSDIIEELKEAIESAGLHTDTVDVAPMALYNAVRYNYGDVDGCTVVLDIGARTTNLLFLEKNKLFSRSIPIAGNAITQSIAAEFNIPFFDAERLKKSKGFVALGGAYEEPPDETQARVSKIIRNVMTRLHAEVARSINFYKGQQGGGTPARMLLSGGSSIIPYTDRFFQEKVQLPVEYFNPFRNVEIDPHVSRDDLARCAHFFGEVVGLGLRKVAECPIEVSLVPKSVRKRNQMQQKQPYLVGTALCLLLIPLCGWLYTNKTARLKAHELESVRTHLEQIESLSGQVNREQTRLGELQGKADQIVNLVQQRSLWPAMLEDLNERLVTNLWIVSFTPQVGGGEGISSPAPAPRPRPGRVRGPVAEEERPEPEAAPAAAAAPQTHDITEILIDGMGNHAADNPDQDIQLVDRFAQNLRESPFFNKKGVEIVTLPALKDDKFTFTIRAKLAKPIAL